MGNRRPDWSPTIRLIDKLHTFLSEHEIAAEDICITGSACLAVRNLRANGDLDFIIHPEVMDELKYEYVPPGLSITPGVYECIGLSDEEVITDSTYHDYYGQYKVVRPEVLLSYKYLRGLPKDRADRHLLGKYIKHTDDFNWSLMRSGKEAYDRGSDDESAGSSLLPLIAAGFKSLRTNGVIETADETANYLLSDEQYRTIDKIRSKYNPRKPDREYVHSGELVHRQFDEDGFRSYDIFLASAEYRGEFDGDFLSSSGNFDYGTPVPLNAQYKILDPGLFVEYLYRGTHVIPVKRIAADADQARDRRWAADQGFDEEILTAHKAEVFEKSGYAPYITLWGSARDEFDEIERDIGEYYDVLNSYTVTLSDRLGEYIEAYYQVHYNAKSHGDAFLVERRKHLLSQHSPVIKIVIPDVSYTPSEEALFEEVREMKLTLRERYRGSDPEIKEVLPKMVLHTPDTFDENVRLQKITNAFAERVESTAVKQ